MLASGFLWLGKARESVVTETGVGRVDAVRVDEIDMLDNGVLAIWDPDSGVQGVIDFGESSARADRRPASLFPVHSDRSRECDRCRVDREWGEV